MERRISSREVMPITIQGSALTHPACRCAAFRSWVAVRTGSLPRVRRSRGPPDEHQPCSLPLRRHRHPTCNTQYRSVIDDSAADGEDFRTTCATAMCGFGRRSRNVHDEAEVAEEGVDDPVAGHPQSARSPVASMLMSGGVPRSTSMTARSSCPWRHRYRTPAAVGVPTRMFVQVMRESR